MNRCDSCGVNGGHAVDCKVGRWASCFTLIAVVTVVAFWVAVGAAACRELGP